MIIKIISQNVYSCIQVFKSKYLNWQKNFAIVRRLKCHLNLDTSFAIFAQSRLESVRDKFYKTHRKDNVHSSDGMKINEKRPGLAHLKMSVEALCLFQKELATNHLAL